MKSKLTNKILVPAMIIAVLIVCAALWIWTVLRPKGNVVVIRREDNIIEEIDLSKVEKPYTIDLKTNVIYIRKDGVSMKSAECPDKICVHTGRICEKGEAIVCAPNKIMIEFKDKDGKVDAVAGGR